MVDWDYGEENTPFKSTTSSAEVMACEANFCFHCHLLFYYASLEMGRYSNIYDQFNLWPPYR